MVVLVCRGCVCAPANLSSEWVHTQSCFCFWGLLSRGRTIPPVSTPPILFSFSLSPAAFYLSIVWHTLLLPKHRGPVIWFTDPSAWTRLEDREGRACRSVCLRVLVHIFWFGKHWQSFILCEEGKKKAISWNSHKRASGRGKDFDVMLEAH